MATPRIRDEDRPVYWCGAVGNVCATAGLLLALPGADAGWGLLVLGVALLAGAAVAAVVSVLALVVLHVRRRR